MTPKVSICIPAYNELKYLSKTLDSIQIQTYQEYEIIVTDDSPDDSVRQLLREYDFHGKLKYIKNRARKGSPENWNEAVRHSIGDYIKILHHDDWFAAEDSLSEFVRMLDASPNVPFGFCSTINIHEDNRVSNFTPDRKQLRKLSGNPNSLLTFDAVIGSPSVTIYRKDANISFDKRLKWLVDIDFYIRVLKQGKQFAFNPRPLICVSARAQGRVTSECENSRDINLFEFFYLLKKVEGGNISDYKYMPHIIRNYLYNYRVSSGDELLNIGVDAPLSPLVRRAIFLNRLLMRYRLQIRRIHKLVFQLKGMA